MISRRLALAVGLLLAVLASQLPEFLQQYRQRLGGAIDGLTSLITQFDSQANALSLNRDQGIARLRDNADALAHQRGESMAEMVARKDRLERQQLAFAVAGPASQYVVFFENVDMRIARSTAADFQPGIPVTVAGFVNAALGFLIGWLLFLAATIPARRTAARSPHATNWM